MPDILTALKDELSRLQQQMDTVETTIKLYGGNARVEKHPGFTKVTGRAKQSVLSRYEAFR